MKDSSHLTDQQIYALILITFVVMGLLSAMF